MVRQKHLERINRRDFQNCTTIKKNSTEEKKHLKIAHSSCRKK